MKDSKYIQELFSILEDFPNVRKATKFIDFNKTIKVTRISFGKKPDKKNARINEYKVTIGKPNFEEREFLNDCKKAGLTVPVKKPQLKLYKNGS